MGERLPDTGDLTDALLEELTDLRTVATGYVDMRDYEITYMDDEIAKLYPEDQRDEILEDTLLEAIAEKRQERLFELGDLSFTVRVFDSGINVLAWGEEDRAVFVGMGAQVDEIPVVIENCRRL